MERFSNGAKALLSGLTRAPKTKPKPTLFYWLMRLTIATSNVIFITKPKHLLGNFAAKL
jgi:hypothetical protein